MMPYRSKASRSNQLAELQIVGDRGDHRQVVVGREDLQAQRASCGVTDSRCDTTQKRGPSQGRSL